jgi:hypothetical protein
VGTPSRRLRCWPRGRADDLDHMSSRACGHAPSGDYAQIHRGCPGCLCLLACQPAHGHSAVGAGRLVAPPVASGVGSTRLLLARHDALRGRWAIGARWKAKRRHLRVSGRTEASSARYPMTMSRKLERARDQSLLLFEELVTSRNFRGGSEDR